MHQLKNKKLTVNIDKKSGEVLSVIKNGVERLWQNEDGSWDGHCPVLFPACGHVGLNYNNKIYDLPPHGFAKNKTFTVVKANNRRIELSLKYDEETLKVYPFKFDFRMRYKIKGDVLTFEYQVKNLGENNLFFSCGGHESFLLDESIDNYSLHFNKNEIFLNYCNNEDGYLTCKTDVLGQGRELKLKDEWFNNSLSLIFKELKSDKVLLLKENTPIAQISYKGFDVLVVWKEYGSKFICIEPWLNLPDTVNNINDKIETKFGLVQVKPNKIKKIKQTVKYF